MFDMQVFFLFADRDRHFVILKRAQSESNKIGDRCHIYIIMIMTILKFKMTDTIQLRMYILLQLCVSICSYYYSVTFQK